MITTDRYKHFVQCKDASVQKETDEGKCVFKYIIYCMYYILYYMFYTFIDISAKYVISRSHYMFMARLSYLEVKGDSGGVTGEKAAKPGTAVRDRVSTFVRVISLCFYENIRIISCHVCGDTRGIFLFLGLLWLY